MADSTRHEEDSPYATEIVDDPPESPPTAAPPNASGAEENPWGDAPAAEATTTARGDGTASEAASQPDPRAAGNSKSSEPPKPPELDYKDRRIIALEESLEERDGTLREYIAAHKAEKANMEAFKSRLLRDQQMELRAAAAKRAEGLIDVLDNLFLSAQGCREGGELDVLIQGVEMVASQFLAALETDGLRRVVPTGEAFDPNTMEAMTTVPVDDEAQDNVVLSTLKPGYWLGDRELRPAMVTVGRFTR